MKFINLKKTEYDNCIGFFCDSKDPKSVISISDGKFPVLDNLHNQSATAINSTMEDRNIDATFYAIESDYRTIFVYILSYNNNIDHIEVKDMIYSSLMDFHDLENPKTDLEGFKKENITYGILMLESILSNINQDKSIFLYKKI